MNKNHEHIIGSVLRGSIAEELEIEPGDKLISINGNKIEDIFDYQYYSQEEELTLVVEKEDGESWELDIEKDSEEDLGIVFENGLMDDYRSCSNKCIFCFIDQNPGGMRESLYFKDDDSRLSFLQGNYVTMTNMSEHDVERIIKYRLSPINVSIHTMNPELRCKMLKNRFAGEALKKIDRFYEAGIVMNGQIVLVPEWNDGKELEYTISQLMKYLPVMESVSVVPVGLTRFREGLEPIRTFTSEESGEVIDIIEKYQKIAFEKYGYHFIHASDEWYIVAGREMPEAERYDGYLQLDNGVGQTRLMIDEFEDEFKNVLSMYENGSLKKTNKSLNTSLNMSPDNSSGEKRCISLICGRLISEIMNSLIDRINQTFDWMDVRLYTIRNDFYGEKITVTGLIVGSDIINQLKGKELGERLYLPETVLRSGEDVFLDDKHVTDVESALQVHVGIVKSSGRELLRTLLGFNE